MSPYDPDQQSEPKEKSIFGVIIHSFFVIPFLIAVFAVLLFAAVRILTMEKQTVYDLLEDVKIGGQTKRWQSAFELSKILGNPDLVPQEEKFNTQMIKAFKESKNDDSRVRQYLALAMGRTGRAEYAAPILEDIKDEQEDNLYALIYALGLLKSQKATSAIIPYLDHPSPKIRLVSAIALGGIGDRQAINFLKKALNDSEPNVQWDAAISLAKMNNASGRKILLNLLDRNYLAKFPNVDIQSQTHVVLTTIEAASMLNDDQLNAAIRHLAETDQNMKVRKLAMEKLEKK